MENIVVRPCLTWLISASLQYTLLPNAKAKIYTTYRTNDARGMVPIIFYIITPYDTRRCQHNNTYSHIVIYSLGNYVNTMLNNMCTAQVVHIYIYLSIYLLPLLTHIPKNQQQHLISWLGSANQSLSRPRLAAKLVCGSSQQAKINRLPSTVEEVEETTPRL